MNAHTETRPYRSKDLVRLGASKRQLQWWAEREIVTPEIIGHDRQYSNVEAIQVGIAARLRRKCPLAVVRSALALYRAQIAHGDEPTYLLVERRACRYLMDVPSVIEETLGARRGVVLVDVGEIRAHVQRIRPSGARR